MTAADSTFAERAGLPSDALWDLDDDQREAVTAPPGLVAVIAGAGSGKTTVLTRRLLHRIATGSADARHTVAITFTRQAAAELRRRLHRAGIHDEVVAGTFHATAFGVLRQRWSDQGVPAPSVLSDRRRLVGEVLGEGNRRSNRSPAAGELAAEIDWARARLITPDRYEAHARAEGRNPTTGLARAAEIYDAYEALKRRRRVVDLDDLLTHLLDAMRQDRTFAEVVRWRFRHLHLDEAQDLNPLQHAVLEAWRGGRDDLFLVGDPAQAIYGWNGAEARLLVEVERHYPGITVVRLERNYRCTPQVVHLGRHLLQGAELGGALHSARADGPAVALHGCADEHAEADLVARLVRGARPPGGRYASIAVLVRTNAQAAALTTRLAAASVPVRTARRHSPLDQALAEAAAEGGLHRLLSWAAEVLDAGHPDAHLADEAEHTIARRRVAAAVDEFVSVTGGGDGRAFSSWARTTGVLHDADDDRDGVDVLTFHAAKGREWPTVIVSGFEQRLVPHRSARTADQAAEETRLAYVAVTRGISQVHLTWAETRNGQPAGRSPLLAGYECEEGVVVPPPPSLVGRRRPLSPAERSLAALHEWRRAAARAAAVPEAVVCSDRELRDLAQLADRQADLDDVADVIGAMAAHHHGPRILAALDEPRLPT